MLPIFNVKRVVANVYSCCRRGMLSNVDLCIITRMETVPKSYSDEKKLNDGWERGKKDSISEMCRHKIMHV